jgi:hypothetical protein
MLIKPVHSLQKRLLLAKLLDLLARITPNTETMAHTTIQVNLVRLLSLSEDRFGLVAFFGRKDLICLCGSNRERSRDGSELGFLHERRVSNVTDIDALSLWHETNSVFGSLFNTLATCWTKVRKGRKVD